MPAMIELIASASNHKRWGDQPSTNDRSSPARDAAGQLPHIRSRRLVHAPSTIPIATGSAVHSSIPMVDEYALVRIRPANARYAQMISTP